MFFNYFLNFRICVPQDNLIYICVFFGHTGVCMPQSIALGKNSSPVKKYSRVAAVNHFLIKYLTIFHNQFLVRITVWDRAPCAPITNTCSMSAVLDGPEMNVP